MLFSNKYPTSSKPAILSHSKFHTRDLINHVDNINIFYTSPIEELCDFNKCPSVINNKLIYADISGQFTEEGAILLVDFWLKTLNKF